MYNSTNKVRENVNNIFSFTSVALPAFKGSLFTGVSKKEGKIALNHPKP